jgi:hypothetical protein
MKFEKRLRALEARMITNPVVLYFADGSTRAICGQGDFLLRLLKGVFGRADLSPSQAAQLDLIRHPEVRRDCQRAEGVSVRAGTGWRAIG